MPHIFNILPSVGIVGHMLTRVAVLALPDLAVFELGVLVEIFGYEREGLPKYDFALCSYRKQPVRTHAGFYVSPEHDLDVIDRADLVAVAPSDNGQTPPEPVLEALRRAADRGAWVLSLCTGAFALGAAGLLDDRRCTTHWRHTDRLADLYPKAKVDPNVLYVADGNVITSAGTAASIDAGLYLVREVHGSAVATALARRMVVPPHRDGGQAQYIESPVAATVEAPTLQPLLADVLASLDQPHTVDTLAARAHMAPRTFARRFRAETGATPHDWLTNQRVLLARRLLEESDLGIDAIAARAGFGSAATLRHHFTQRMSTTPQAYRSTFKVRSIV
jgi:transcriptional regulator GlxA family with amidase domain